MFLKKRSLLFVLVVFSVLFISSCESSEFSEAEYSKLSSSAKLVIAKMYERDDDGNSMFTRSCTPWETIYQCEEPGNPCDSVSGLQKARQSRYCSPPPPPDPCAGVTDPMADCPHIVLSPSLDSKEFEIDFRVEGNTLIIDDESVVKEISNFFSGFGAKFSEERRVVNLFNAERNRGWEYRCVSNSLCKRTCGDGLSNNINNAPDLSCDGVFASPEEEQIYFDAYPNSPWNPDAFSLRDNGCQNYFGEGGAYGDDHGVCTEGTGTNGNLFLMDAPGVWTEEEGGDSREYAILTNPNYYNYFGGTTDEPFTSYGLCGGNGNNYCYVSLDGDSYENDGTLCRTSNPAICLNFFVYMGDHKCQGWESFENYVVCPAGADCEFNGECSEGYSCMDGNCREENCAFGTVDYSPYQNSEAGGSIEDVDGWFKLNDYASVDADAIDSDSWTSGTVESSRIGWLDANEIWQHDCPGGPLDCEGEEYRELNCQPGDSYSGGEIDWANYTLNGPEGSVSAEYCGYGIKTETCSGWHYTGDWEDCTGISYNLSEHADSEKTGNENCEDGIDNDCDGNVDDYDIGCQDCDENDSNLDVYGTPANGICEGLTGGVCGYGYYSADCVGGFWEDWSENYADCLGIDSAPLDSEICNNMVDDDCNDIPEENELSCTGPFGSQWLSIPDFSSEQGRENSLTLDNGLPFFVYKYKVGGNLVSLAYAKYVGNDNGNCGYEGGEGTIPVQNFQCGFVEQGEEGWIVPIDVGDENSIISDGSNVYVSYTHREGSGQQKLRFAEYVGAGSGDCGYSIVNGTGEPSTQDNSWNCKDASDLYGDLTSPQTVSVGGTPYVIFASNNFVHINKITSEGYSNTNLDIVDSTEEIMWISAEYSGDENKIYFIFSTGDIDDPTIKYKLYYSYIDVSASPSIYNFPTYIDTLNDGPDYYPMVNDMGDQIDISLENNCNDDSSGSCNLHAISSYVTDNIAYSLRYNSADVGANSNSPIFTSQNLSGLAGTGLGIVPSIEMDSEGLPHMLAKSMLSSELPVYVFKNPEGSEESYSIIDNFEADDTYGGWHSVLKLDNSNRAHMIYIVDKDSEDGTEAPDWRIRYSSFLAESG